MKLNNRGYSRALPLLLVLLLTLSGCFQEGSGTKKSSSMHWIEDKSGVMTFDEIRNKKLSTEWQLTQGHYPNFGFTQSAFWLSLPFENTENAHTQMLLEIAFPLHDSIEFYLLDGNEVVSSYVTGDQQAFSERPLNHRNFLFPYSVPPKGKLRAVVRVQSSDTMYLPVKIWKSNEFFTKDQSEILLLGIFFGFLSIMLIYNLLLYISTGHKHYLYYVWCTASIIYLQLTQKGLGYQYFWSEKTFFNHMSVPLSSFIAIVTSLFFISKFLDLDKKLYTKTVHTFQTFIWISLVGIILLAVILNLRAFIVPYFVIMMSTVVTGAVATVVIMAVLIRLAINGNPSARILTVAWLSLLSGSLLFVLGRIGVPLPMILSENAMLIGSTVEAALISFALARHIKTEREARVKAQELALTNERKTLEAQNSLLKLQEKTTQQLEQEVKERTQKLETAMQKLTLANQKLDNLSRLDSLTGLSNRRNFDQEFNEAWLSCSQQHQPMSLLMADIDYFKAINDSYGHLFGDECLIEVANILKQCVNEPQELAARFGGEEFIIMLPNTDAKRAGLVAELIRSSIEQLRLKYEEQPIQFTISIGLATAVPNSSISFIDLNESADQALYLAKERGRNQVVTFGDTTRKTDAPSKVANLTL